MDVKKREELERILSEPEPNVIVNRDGSCSPASSPGNRDDVLATIRNAVKLARTYGDSVGAINVIEAALATPVVSGNHEQALREAQADAIICSLQENSNHIELPDADAIDETKELIVAALAASEPASQGAQAGELDVLSWLKENFPYTWETFNTGHHDAIRAAYAAGQAAQPLQREAGQGDHDSEVFNDGYEHGMYDAKVAAAPLQPQVEELRELSEKATPGPWAATTRQGSWDWLICVPGTPFEICQMFHDGDDLNEQGEANTKLIVACVNAVRKWIAPTEAAQQGTQECGK